MGLKKNAQLELTSNVKSPKRNKQHGIPQWNDWENCAKEVLNAKW